MRKTQLMSVFILIFILLGFYSSCGNESDENNTEAIKITSEVTESQTTEADSAVVSEEYTQPVTSSPKNPSFSIEGGFYTSSIALTLNMPDDKTGVYAIRYTTNGDEPTGSSTKYEKDITLLEARESVVVRAACFSRSGDILGNIITNTYIKTKTDFAGKIICISASHDSLTGQRGIFTNPTMSGKEWERAAHVEIYDNTGNRIINQDAGLRVFGGSSRVLQQKGLRLVARKTDYFNDIRYNGEGSFKYPFFEERIITTETGESRILDKYDRLVLRNGGNDSFQSVAADPMQMNLVRDGVANNFAAIIAPSVTVQLSEFAVVYLNGQYYGLLDLKEDIEEDYAKNVYSITDKENTAFVKSELDTTRHCSSHANGGSCRFCNVWFFYEMDQGEVSEIERFLSLCKKAIETKTESERAIVYNEISAAIDMDNFMQYCALNLYMCNTDWPHNNLRMWRYTGTAYAQNSYKDGKWRFTMRDMDFTMGRYQNLVLPEIYSMADTDTFYRALGNYWNGGYNYDINSGLYPDSLLLQGLLDFCLKNNGFKEDFILYCNSLVSEENTKLLKKIVGEYADSADAEIARHIKRWTGTIDGKYTYENWLKQIDAVYSWIDSRSEYFVSYLNTAMEKY